MRLINSNLRSATINLIFSSIPSLAILLFYLKIGLKPTEIWGSSHSKALKFSFLWKYPTYGLSHTPTPTQKFKNGFSIFSSQEIGSSLVPLEMIFQALHSELVRFKVHSLGSKIKKIPELSPTITSSLEDQAV